MSMATTVDYENSASIENKSKLNSQNGLGFDGLTLGGASVTAPSGHLPWLQLFDSM